MVGIFIFIFAGYLWPQSTTIDSLKNALELVEGKEQVDILIRLSGLYRSNDLEKGWNMAEDALELAVKTGYRDGEGDALLNMGRVKHSSGLYTEAMEYFLKALTIYESTDNKLQMAYVHNDMGFIYYSLKEPEKLSIELNSALAIFEAIGDEKGIADVTNNLGVHHDLIGNLDSAIIFYERSLKTNIKLGAHQEAANCRINMASVFTVQKKFDKARAYIEEANAYFIKSNDKNAQVVILIEKASLAVIEEGYPSAIQYLEEGYTLADNIGSLLRAKNISGKLVEYYSKIGDAASSYKYFEIYDALKDSIYNENNARLLTEMETSYQTELKEKEIEALNVTNQQERFRRNAFAGLSVLILIVSLLLINRKRLEARKNRLLYFKGQEVEKTKSHFFANITHEFRTPLTLILGPIEVLKTKITSSEGAGQLNVMEKNANRLLDLINQLLDISKIESGNMKLQTEEVDITLIIKRVCGLFESSAERKKITLSIEPGLTNTISYLDADKIEKVFVNLISNALKFTHEGGTISITLTEKNGSDGPGSSDIEVKVKDDGEGIPEGDLEHIFDQYFQSDHPEGGEYAGTGIGLALTKELVELHLGTISVLSEPGHGTEFTVTLPAGGEVTPQYKFRKKTPNELPVDSTGLPEKSGQKPLLLLIEDNEDVRDYVRNIMASDYKIELAINGLLGVEKALEIIPDLVISDVMMPGMNGYQVCERLKSDEKTSHIPLILLTAKAAVEDRIEGLEHKADDYIVKPFVPKELQVRSSNLIENRLRMREKFSKEFVFKPGEIEVSSVEDKFLEKLKNELEKNLDNDQLGVEDIAGSMSMSRSQLLRKLKALTNLTPNEFIRNYRLVRARELILNDAGSTAEIAFDVGFSSPSYFTRCFREYFGIPPSEMRQNL